MGSKKQSIQPTDAELAILQILWKRGPSTVREVHEDLARTKKAGYTTTLKLMQIMHQKGMLKRDDEARSHVYMAVVRESETQSALLDRLLQSAFSGSAMKLVMKALGNHRASKEELHQIKKLIDQIEQNHEDHDNDPDK